MWEGDDGDDGDDSGDDGMSVYIIIYDNGHDATL